MVHKKKIVQSGVWQMLNVFVKFFSQFVYFAILNRLLGMGAMGVFAILNSFMNVGNILGDGGMGDALLQRKEIDKQHINAAFWSSMLVSGILYVILFIASPWIADFYTEPSLNLSLRLFGIVFLFAGMYSAPLNVLQRRFSFKKIFVGDGVCLLLSNIFGIALAYKGFGVISLVYSQLFYFGTKLIVFWYYAPVPLKAGYTKQHWKDLIGYGSGLTLIRVNNYVINFGIILEVGKLVEKKLLGIFDRTYRIMNIPQRLLYDMVQRVMMPAMVSKTDGQKGTFPLFYKTLSLMNTVFIPFTLFLILFSKQIVLIQLGKKGIEGVLLMQIFFLSLPLRMASSLGDTLMRVHGLIKQNLYRKIQNSIAVVILIYAGYKWQGITGIGWAVLASTIISYLLMMIVVRKYIFPDDWQKLILKPCYNGFKLCIIWVLPCYATYLLAHFFIHEEITSFIVASTIIGAAAAIAFIKKPKLLSNDIASIQPDIIGMVKKKKGKKNKEVAEENENLSLPQGHNENFFLTGDE